MVAMEARTLWPLLEYHLSAFGRGMKGFRQSGYFERDWWLVDELRGRWGCPCRHWEILRYRDLCRRWRGGLRGCGCGRQVDGAVLWECMRLRRGPSLVWRACQRRGAEKDSLLACACSAPIYNFDITSIQFQYNFNTASIQLQYNFNTTSIQLRLHNSNSNSHVLSPSSPSSSKTSFLHPRTTRLSSRLPALLLLSCSSKSTTLHPSFPLDNDKSPCLGNRCHHRATRHATRPQRRCSRPRIHATKRKPLCLFSLSFRTSFFVFAVCHSLSVDKPQAPFQRFQLLCHPQTQAHSVPLDAQTLGPQNQTHRQWSERMATSQGRHQQSRLIYSRSATLPSLFYHLSLIPWQSWLSLLTSFSLPFTKVWKRTSTPRYVQSQSM